MDQLHEGLRPDGRRPAVRLGHISYSNCFPIHSRLIDQPREGDPQLVVGIPSELNRALEAGEIDVAPCSSIEYARHADRYRILPDLVIGSRGAVRSIIFSSTMDPSELGGKLVAIPNASATSVVLLKILLRERWGVQAEFRWFDQRVEDPFASGAAAALYIGDVALNLDATGTGRIDFDLGSEWSEHTGLPFAFAVWQGSADAPDPDKLHSLLLESRRYGLENVESLAGRYAEHFGFDPGFLRRYWDGLNFELDPSMMEGLDRFYRLAAKLGEIDRIPDLKSEDCG